MDKRGTLQIYDVLIPEITPTPHGSKGFKPPAVFEGQTAKKTAEKRLHFIIFYN